MGKRETDEHSFFESLGIPQDVKAGETLLTFLGEGTVFVENYRNLLLYSETKVQLQAKKYRLTIEGEGLSIARYDKEYMKITGKIGRVEFC